MGETAWSPDAAELMTFVYKFWVAERRPPNLFDVHRGTGFDFRTARRLYRELQAGFGVAFLDDRWQIGITKAPPFSATATPVGCYMGDQFLSYLGCPAEVFTVGRLPMLEDETLTIRSYCGCCYEPIELDIKGQDVVRCEGPEPLLVIMSSPWEWENGVPPDRVCDTIHFALDATHGARLQDVFTRKGVLMTIGQMQGASKSIADERMRDPHWGPYRMDGGRTVDGFGALGVDVSTWR
jgi:hypothetical protein